MRTGSYIIHDDNPIYWNYLEFY